MVAQILALGTFVALAQAKAIITNHCGSDVHVWSVPFVEGVADNLSIGPGKRYEEPWRYGTPTNPGIALKISTEHNGIYNSKSEINFAYTVEVVDPSKIWISVETVRGPEFDNVTFHTCEGEYTQADMPAMGPPFCGQPDTLWPCITPHLCTSTNDIELVLCGTERTTAIIDSTPSNMISRCIGGLQERDTHARPRQCNGRVLGSKWRLQPQGERTDGYGDDQIGTIPLKTIMRQEAAKHVASQPSEVYISGKSRSTRSHLSAEENSGPICRIFQKAWPGGRCDEEIAEHNARQFYADDCGPKTKNMFPGMDCQAIREAIKLILPDADKEASPRDASIPKGDDHVLCLKPAYDMFALHWGSKGKVRRYINEIFPDYRWTSDGRVCSDYPGIEKWTFKWFSKISDHTPAFEPAVRCVKPYCQPVLSGSCDDVAAALGVLSVYAGKPTDFTSDSDECELHAERGLGKPEPADNETTYAPHHDVRKVCIISANEKLGKYWGAQETERKVKEDIFPDIPWVSDTDDCSPLAMQATRDYYHKLIDKKKKKVKQCVTPYCRPYGVACKGVEDALGSLSKDLGKRLDWTSDSDVCGEPIDRRSDDTMVPEPQPDKCGKVCWGRATKSLVKFWPDDQQWLRFNVEEAFPNVPFTDNESACEPEVIKKTQACYRGQTPKVTVKTCIFPWCRRTRLRNCSRLLKMMRGVTEDLGLNMDWVTTGEECGALIPNESSNKTKQSHDKCKQQHKRDLTTAAKRRLVQKCIKPYCHPYIDGANCDELAGALDWIAAKYNPIPNGPPEQTDFVSNHEVCADFNSSEPLEYDEGGYIKSCTTKLCDDLNIPNCAYLATELSTFYQKKYDVKITWDISAC